MWLFELPEWQLHNRLLPGTFWSKDRRLNHSAIMLSNFLSESTVWLYQIAILCMYTKIFTNGWLMQEKLYLICFILFLQEFCLFLVLDSKSCQQIRAYGMQSRSSTRQTYSTWSLQMGWCQRKTSFTTSWFGCSRTCSWWCRYKE